MIIVDFRQTMVACLMAGIDNHHNVELTEGLLRHMVLNSLRAIGNKFRDSHGEMIIASDGKNIWRKGVFPYYKYSRKKSREESEINWSMVFDTFDKIEAEISVYMPYKVVRVEEAEADDVISVMVRDASAAGQPVVIVSGDGDFVQLHSLPGVNQWNHIKKDWVKPVESPKIDLMVKIIKGDAGDGVPNILSQDDTFVIAKRQKNVYKTKLADWVNMKPEEFCTEGDMLRNFKRNEMLVDLTKIPSSIEQSIRDKYEEAKIGKEGYRRTAILDYFVEYRLRDLMESVQEFK